jgi:hypothetical protein
VWGKKLPGESARAVSYGAREQYPHDQHEFVLQRIDATNLTSNEGAISDNISPASDMPEEVKLQPSMYAYSDAVLEPTRRT